MARISADQLLLPSLLDRLLDDSPEVRQDPPRSPSQQLRDQKLSVRRDLENLLNTRRRLKTWPEQLAELEKSLVNYGIPDFAGSSFTSPQERENLCRVLETILRTFEPRFKTVSVHLLDNTETLDRSLRFRIDALMHAEPAPEAVTFDSRLEPVSGTFELRGGN